MGFWVNVWKYPSVVKQVLSDVKNITSELELLKNDPHLPEAAKQILNHKKAFHRVSQYALVHGVLNLGIARYWGRTLSANEMKSTIYTCAFGPFFDDFIDDYQLNEQDLFQLIEENDDILGNSAEEQAYRYLLGIVFKTAPDKIQFQKQFQRLLEAQIDSKRLKNKSENKSSLTSISRTKGEESAILFRVLIAEDIHTQELNMLRQLGVVGQFMDDIFDLHDDYHEGLQTLANDYTTDFEPIYRRFQQEVQSLKHEIDLLPFPRKQTECFWHELMLMISGGLLACKTFLKVQQKYGHLDLNIIPRKELIVDMESKKNHVKMLLLALKHA
jgi:hypothetical protein